MSNPTNQSTAAAAATTTPKLQTLNYVNVLAYLSYFLALFGCSKAGLPDNAELSDKYQTLITPSPYAFAIWGIIFTAELVWTIFQVTPSYRTHPLVVKGVGYDFALACLAQATWTVFFSLEDIPLSLVAMFVILIPLLRILDKTRTTKTTLGDYWLLKFPFQIHCSWVLCATFLNVNVLVASVGASAPVQTIFGTGSLLMLFGAGIAELRCKTTHQKKVWVVPCVVAWASFAIARELSNPRDQIAERFPEATIAHTKTASSGVGCVLLLLVGLALLRDLTGPAPAAVADGDDDDVLDSDGEREGQDSGQQYSPLD